MNIHWLVHGVQMDAIGAPRSALATNRYRAILPAQGLRQRGHQVELIDLTGWRPETYSTHDRPDVIVVGKLLPGPRFETLKTRLLSGIETAQGQGIRVVADINDDHFDDPVLGPLWRALSTRADTVVAGSETMARVVSAYSPVPVHVVGDPVASPRGQPSVFRPATGIAYALQSVLAALGYGQACLRLVWFGSHTNWPAMAAWVPALTRLSRRQPWHLTVVCRPGAGIETYVAGFQAAKPAGATIEFQPWQEETVWQHVAEAHMVLIPADLSRRAKAVKSANRLVDALHCGRFVVASPVPAYQTYGEFAWLGDDPLVGIEWALSHPDEAMAMIRRGQEKIAAAHSIETISQAWMAVLMQTTQAANVSSKSVGEAIEVKESTKSKQVRLNLGCGDKILDGYINVDVAPNRAGKSPDVLCDLRELDACFTENSVDEILAVHVIEHFWRWEVEDILRGWVRVLKPGGLLIIECPNLLSACEALLADPQTAAQADARGRMSMWVFYGDPAWEDPLMCHRWGYTPSSLCALLERIGLVNVRQEPAQFKMREPRDMRIVGIKPMSTLE